MQKALGTVCTSNGIKVFYISPQCFSCKFLFLFIFLCQTNIQQARKYGVTYETRCVHYLMIIFLPLTIYIPLGRALISSVLALLSRFVPSIV